VISQGSTPSLPQTFTSDTGRSGLSVPEGQLVAAGSACQLGGDVEGHDGPILRCPRPPPRCPVAPEGDRPGASRRPGAPGRSLRPWSRPRRGCRRRRRARGRGRLPVGWRSDRIRGQSGSMDRQSQVSAWPGSRGRFPPAGQRQQPHCKGVVAGPGEPIMSDKVHFPAGTDLTMAKAIALKEFPNPCQVRGRMLVRGRSHPQGRGGHRTLSSHGRPPLQPRRQ